MKYDYLIPYLPKQYLFYSDEFHKLLTEENNNFLNNKAKATFFEIFGKDKFAKISPFFDKPATKIGGYINNAYLLISSVSLVFLVWPSIVLKSATISMGFFSIFLTLPLYWASVYLLFRITGKIKLGWLERREQRFFKKIQKEFSSELKRFKNSEEIVLEFQQRIPLLLLQERERYTICLTGLLKYFMPRTQRNLISVKFMEDNWDDLVCSLMYGSLQGVMGGLPLSVETLQKISELMSMLVILDVLTRDNEQVNLLMEKIRQFYGLKGK